MSTLAPPPSLPPYTFLMSDHTTRQLACDVAEELSQLNHTVYIDDFLTPIHDALAAMLELDMKRDLGSPSNTNRLVLETVEECTEQDLINSLERWHIKRFGEDALARIALKRAQYNRANFDYSYVFRDARPIHVEAFNSIPARDKYIVPLTVDDTVASIVKRIVENSNA